jgi:cytochrome o ubiquinol oxidase operon protein cyoD
MSEAKDVPDEDFGDSAPGESDDVGSGVRTYVIGLALATLLTIASFGVGATHFIWAPAVPVALVVFAIAQMGIHLVFFLHVTTGPDNTNNVVALAFGVMVVVLVVIGSIWIMGHLNHNMMTPEQMMRMQR